MAADYGKYFPSLNVVLEYGRLFTAALNIATDFISFKKN
jgi:hypothetical protein